MEKSKNLGHPTSNCSGNSQKDAFFKRIHEVIAGDKTNNLHPDHPFEIEVVLSPEENEYRQEEFNKLMNDRRFKIPDLYLSRHAKELRIDDIVMIPTIFGHHIDVEDGRHWLHIPYNDRDIIDRRASLMEHLKAQCPKEMNSRIINIDSTEFFSGSLAFLDPFIVFNRPVFGYVDYNHCDLVIHIGLSDDVYEEFESRQKNSDSLGKPVIFCSRYSDADEMMLEDMEEGYYPLLKAKDFEKLFLINWNDPFWDSLADPEVTIAVSTPPRAYATWSSSRIAYTSYDPTHPGDLVVDPKTDLEKMFRESDLKKKYASPEEAYLDKGLRDGIKKSYIDERVLYINRNDFDNK